VRLGSQVALAPEIGSGRSIRKLIVEVRIHEWVVQVILRNSTGTCKYTRTDFIGYIGVVREISMLHDQLRPISGIEFLLIPIGYQNQGVNLTACSYLSEELDPSLRND